MEGVKKCLFRTCTEEGTRAPGVWRSIEAMGFSWRGSALSSATSGWALGIAENAKVWRPTHTSRWPGRRSSYDSIKEKNPEGTGAHCVIEEGTSR